MLDLCGRHGGTCGNALHILGDDKSADTCDVVKEICQQVDEDTIYSMDHWEDMYNLEAFERNEDLVVRGKIAKNLHLSFLSSLSCFFSFYAFQRAPSGYPHCAPSRVPCA